MAVGSETVLFIAGGIVAVGSWVCCVLRYQWSYVESCPVGAWCLTALLLFGWGELSWLCLG